MRRGFFLLWVVVIAIFTLWGMARAENPVFEEPMAGSQYPPKVAMGNNGEVAVAGTITKESGDKDWSVFLYTKGADGEYSVFWHKTYDGGHDDTVSAVAITPLGEVVVVGTTNNGRDDDCLVVVFSKDGEVKWQRSYPGSHSDKGVAVAVKGGSNGEELIAVGAITNNGSNDDLLLLLYNGQGGMAWSKPVIYDSGKNDSLVGIAIAPKGNILVLGNSGEEDTRHWVLLSYEKDGEKDWSKEESGDGVTTATHLALDEKGRALVCGFTNGGEGNDWIMVEYSSSGGVFWRQYYRGDHDDKALWASEIPGLGWAVAGVSYVSKDNGKDGLLMALSDTGSTLWSKWVSGENDQELLQVKGDLSASVVAVGTTNNGKDDDWWIGRYSLSGKEEWSQSYDGGEGDENPAMAMGMSGDMALVGNTGEDWKLMVFAPRYMVETLAQSIVVIAPRAHPDPLKGVFLGVGDVAGQGYSIQFSVSLPVFVDNSTLAPLPVTLYAGLSVPSAGLYFFAPDLKLSTNAIPMVENLRYPAGGTLLSPIKVLDDSGELMPGIPAGEYLFFVAALYGENADNMAAFDWSSQRYFIEYTTIELK